MLQIKTIEPGTLSILRELMAIPSLNQFGGTALALKFGHRSSVDLDLFVHEKFDHKPIVVSFEQVFGDRFDYKQQNTQFGIFCFIDQVKVDIVHYPHQPS